MEIKELALMLLEGSRETLYMTIFSTFFAYVLGVPIGVLLVVTPAKGLRPIPIVNKLLNALTNIVRPIPFVIFLIAVMPLTKAVVGRTYGPTATVMPLVLAAAPFVARMVESSLMEVDAGVIEAAQSMGASPMQIIWKVLLPEAKTSLITGATIALATILGYSAMAGVVGGGGLGDIAIRFGYYRYQTDIMVITVILLIIYVQVFQAIGTKLAKVTDKRIKE
jgi:ABC-type metal ion transport system, permease component